MHNLATTSLQDSEIRSKIVSQSVPADMDRQTARAHKVVSSLFNNKKATHCGRWQGQLPAPWISRPLTLADCPVRKVTSGLGKSRAGEDDVQNLKSDPVSTPGRSGPIPGFWIKVGQSWQRVRLRSAVERHLSKCGSLPIEYRCRGGTQRENLASAFNPSYAKVLARRRVMDGGATSTPITAKASSREDLQPREEHKAAATSKRLQSGAITR